MLLLFDAQTDSDGAQRFEAARPRLDGADVKSARSGRTNVCGYTFRRRRRGVSSGVMKVLDENLKPFRVSARE